MLNFRKAELHKALTQLRKAKLHRAPGSRNSSVLATAFGFRREIPCTLPVRVARNVSNTEVATGSRRRLEVLFRFGYGPGRWFELVDLSDPGRW